MLILGKEIMVASMLCHPKGAFFLFEVKITFSRWKRIMVALMLKIMDSIRIKSDFVANNWFFILWPDLFLFSLKSDFCEKKRFYSFEGSVLWHSREMFDFYKYLEKRNLNVMKINTLNHMFICDSKLMLLSICCQNLFLQNKAIVQVKGPHFDIFCQNI